MKALPWLVAGVGLGLAAYFVFGQPGPQAATGSDDVEDAASKATLWGSKQRITGTGRSLAGKLKEGVGRTMGDEGLADQGVAEQAAGTVKNAAGHAAQAVGETIHDLNR